MESNVSAIDSVQSHHPTLERARMLQEIASAAGLDWPDSADVWTRINEELAEAKAASEDLSILASRIAARTSRRTKANQVGLDTAQDLLRDELGDLLFAVVEVCRHLGVDPDQALEAANNRFASCFRRVEERMGADGFMIALEHPDRLKALWNEVKHTQLPEDFKRRESSPKIYRIAASS